MSIELNSVLIAVVAVGAIIIGLILTGQRAIRTELATHRRDFIAALVEQRREFGERFTALEQQMAELRERMAHLEGLLDGLREAIAIRQGAA